MSDDFQNISKTFEPKVSEKLPKKSQSSADDCAVQDFGGSGFRRIDSFGKTMARIVRFIPLKRPEQEACVSHSHVHCVDASSVINSVRAKGFSYFLFLLFCLRK